MVYGWLRTVQHRLLPTVCRLCCGPGLPGLELCHPCSADLPWIGHACATCALPLPAGSAASHCAHCQQTPGALDHCRALFVYEAPIDSWILAMKFRQDLAAARLFGSLLGKRAEAADASAPEVLPVPLHPKRRRERGYNQALEIARPLRERGYRLALDCCQRRRHTLAQSTLPVDDRQRNLRGAFEAAAPLQGRRFILIDDVLTTGATLNELAGTLKRAGAERVEAWVVARTALR